MTAPLVVAEALAVTYRSEAGMVPALRGIDLTIAPGERVAAVGESGSGKSTLGLAIAYLLPPAAASAGRLAWPGLTDPPRHGADIGFVFQDPGSSLDPVMTVGRQIAEVVEAHERLGRAAGAARADGLLAEVGLPGLRDAYPHQLSGGQKQRVAIAAAIAVRPGLLIADEPTSGLDTIVQAAIVSLLARLVRESGMGLLLISHDLGVAGALADRLLVMKDGVVVEQGPTRTVLAAPKQPYTAALVAARPRLDDGEVMSSRGWTA